MARSAAALVAGLLVSGVALLALVKVWPATLVIGDLGMLDAPRRLARAAFANSAALVGAYVAVAALGWGIADATMDQPRDLEISTRRRRMGTSGASSISPTFTSSASAMASASKAAGRDLAATSGCSRFSSGSKLCTRKRRCTRS